MSETIRYMRNKTKNCYLGILPGQIPEFQQQEKMAFGMPIYLPPGATQPDPNGAMWHSFTHDSDATFVNCDSTEEAMALRVPRQKWAWYERETGILHRGERPTSTPEKRVGDVKFAGFWGVLYAVEDATKEHQHIIDEMKTLSGGVERIKRLETDLANTRNDNADKERALADKDAEILALRAQVLVARGPQDDRKGGKQNKAEAAS